MICKSINTKETKKTVPQCKGEKLRYQNTE